MTGRAGNGTPVPETTVPEGPDDLTSLAIVGLAGRFPGADDADAFWDNLSAGRDTLTRRPAAGGPGTSAHGAVEDADGFDAAFFGYPPAEALLLDPQHRVFTECAWAALEDAGYDPRRFSGAIGVYAGSGDTGYPALLRAHRGRWPEVSDWQLRLASGADFLTTRVAYKLGLTGPAITVQTACSTSLVAVHLAGQALLAGECDLALAGGITVHVPHPDGASGSDGVLSADGYCRPFDAAADGTVAADAAGVVVLKRLADALADDDHVHAVIRGSAVTNDGAAKVGFTAPGVAGQAAAVRAALEVAGLTPDEIGYVEAHGTGTVLGDPIEVRALATVFGDDGRGEGSPGPGCLLGSVKANVGHTDAAAGVVGLIKTVLALRHELIPGTAHFRAPNPALGLADTPFRVTAEPTPWPRTDSPRRAGVNSLGIGGTNAHVILEEAPRPTPSGPGRPVQLLPLSARTPAALAQATHRLAGALSGASNGMPDRPLADVAWTLQTGRAEHAHRAFVVTTGTAPAVAALTGTDPGRLITARAPDRAPRIAFVYPGQGGQHVGMGAELYRHEPEFAAAIDECAALAGPVLGADLRALLYPDSFAGPADAATAMATMTAGQPALFAVQYAATRLWRSWGVVPGVVLGHSLGAYAAAAAAGVLSLPHAITLVLERGRLLAAVPDGAMLAVALPEDELRSRMGPGLSLAAVNAPDQCVVSGARADVEALRERLGDDVEHRLLHIRTAAHSALVAPGLAEFERRLAGVRPETPEVDWISDRTGAVLTGEQARDPAYWSGHLRHTVRFADALDTLLSGPDTLLLELSPGNTLGALARRQPGFRAGHRTVPSLPHPSAGGGGAAETATALGRVWAAGVRIDWVAVHSGERRRRVPLPSYPFERRRFALDTVPGADPRPAPVPVPVPAARPAAWASSDLERAVADAFGEVLGIEDLDPDEDFFDLGGDSLIATRLAGLLHRTLGLEVAARAVFADPTPSRLARALSGGLRPHETAGRPS